MRKRYKFSDIPSLENKSMLFDTNVMIYIFWPVGNNSYTNDYSSIFSSILKNKNPLFVDFLVLSEFINLTLRIEYDNYLSIKGIDKSKFNFKNFRNCAEGQKSLNDIYNIINKSILSKFEIIGKEFLLEDVNSFLKVDNMDFNDKAIELICKEKDLVLVTNDKDFIKSDVEILTTNKILLKEC